MGMRDSLAKARRSGPVVTLLAGTCAFHSRYVRCGQLVGQSKSGESGSVVRAGAGVILVLRCLVTAKSNYPQLTEGLLAIQRLSLLVRTFRSSQLAPKPCECLHAPPSD